MALVCVPLSVSELQEWATRGGLEGAQTGYAATAELREAFGVTDDEQAERIALLAASIAALCHFGYRLIAVIEASPVPSKGADLDFGEVALLSPGFAQVTSIFADQAGVISGSLAGSVAGLSLAEAWEHPEVVELLGSADLLWHDRSEWQDLVKG